MAANLAPNAASIMLEAIRNEVRGKWGLNRKVAVVANNCNRSFLFCDSLLLFTTPLKLIAAIVSVDESNLHNAVVEAAVKRFSPTAKDTKVLFSPTRNASAIVVICIPVAETSRRFNALLVF